MPLSSRRNVTRLPRRLPPRPTFAPDAPAAAAASGDEARQRRDAERAQATAERESRYLIVELKRVAGVTATCVGMLILLAILQRMQT